jgi:aldose 1-epimerase
MLESLAHLIGFCTLIAIANGCAPGAGESLPLLAQAPKLASIQQAPWGSVEGKPVTLFTLTNRHGLVLKVASYGGIITELSVPDRTGKLADIVLGFDDVASYVKSSPYFGAIIGRVANRISGAHFELFGYEYKIEVKYVFFLLYGV